MRTFTTEITALCPIDCTLKTYAGPNVPGISFEDAQSYCERNGLGYCEVTGELMEEIPIKQDGTVDWKNKKSFTNLN